MGNTGLLNLIIIVGIVKVLCSSVFNPLNKLATCGFLMWKSVQNGSLTGIISSYISSY